MSDVDAAALGLTAAVFFPAAAATWRAASFRGDFHNLWQSRVELAEAALHERSINRILLIQDTAADLLLTHRPAALPATIVADLGEVNDHITRFSALYKATLNLRRHFRWIRSLGTLFLAEFLVICVSVPVAGLYFGNIWSARLVGYVAMWTAIVAFSMVALTFIAYVVLHYRLTAAEILANDDNGYDSA